MPSNALSSICGDGVPRPYEFMPSTSAAIPAIAYNPGSSFGSYMHELRAATMPCIQAMDPAPRLHLVASMIHTSQQRSPVWT